MDIKELREKAGITQRQLADAIGVDISTICRYETGKTDPPLSRALQISAFFTNHPNIDHATPNISLSDNDTLSDRKDHPFGTNPDSIYHPAEPSSLMVAESSTAYGKSSEKQQNFDSDQRQDPLADMLYGQLLIDFHQKPKDSISTLRFRNDRLYKYLTLYQEKYENVCKQLIRQKANGQCELCGQQSPFKDDDGLPHLGLYKIDESGSLAPEKNYIALCPNCNSRLRSHISPEELDTITKIAATHNFSEVKVSDY